MTGDEIFVAGIAKVLIMCLLVFKCRSNSLFRVHVVLHFSQKNFGEIGEKFIAKLLLLVAIFCKKKIISRKNTKKLCSETENYFFGVESIPVTREDFEGIFGV